MPSSRFHSLADEAARLGASLSNASVTFEGIERHAVSDLLAQGRLGELRARLRIVRDGAPAWPESAIDFLAELEAGLDRLVGERETFLQRGEVEPVECDRLELVQFLEQWLDSRADLPLERERIEFVRCDPVMVHAHPGLLSEALKHVVLHAARSEGGHRTLKLEVVPRARDMAGVQLSYRTDDARAVDEDPHTAAIWGRTPGAFGLWQALARLAMERQEGLFAVRDDTGPESLVILLMRRCAEEGE